MIKSICAYIKYKRKQIILYACVLGIFAFVFYLYNVKIAAVSYAFLLVTLFLFIIGCIDFYFYVKRYKTLKYMKNSIIYELLDFPETADILEKTYQEIIQVLYEAKTDCEANGIMDKRDMQDYYSLWAHQIKTPISAMKIVLQSEEGNSLSTKSHLKMELFKVEQYVEMVLSYIRIGDMGKDTVFQWYSLDDIVKQSIRKYSQMFILKQIHLDYEEVGHKVLTDEKWLGFVIEQVISNALKYTFKGSIKIYMDKENKGILVIEDSGIGIWQEDLPRVFEKGFTGYNGRSGRKSTGIGLYLCKEIMDRLNHKIWITSEVSKGTSVYLQLQ